MTLIGIIGTLIGITGPSMPTRLFWSARHAGNNMQRAMCAESQRATSSVQHTACLLYNVTVPLVRLVPILILLSRRACCAAVCAHKDHGTSARRVFVVYDDIILNKWLLDSIRNSDKEKK